MYRHCCTFERFAVQRVDIIFPRTGTGLGDRTFCKSRNDKDNTPRRHAQCEVGRFGTCRLRVHCRHVFSTGSAVPRSRDRSLSISETYINRTKSFVVITYYIFFFPNHLPLSFRRNPVYLYTPVSRASVSAGLFR